MQHSDAIPGLARVMRYALPPKIESCLSLTTRRSSRMHWLLSSTLRYSQIWLRDVQWEKICSSKVEDELLLRVS